MSRLQAALKAARETKRLELGRGVIAKTRDLFREQFGNQPAIVITDPHTSRVAGKSVAEMLGALVVQLPADVYAEWKHIDHLDAALRRTEGIPIAVGAGTINDLVKLVAHRAGRRYMCVATAASMDGYTAYGASITKDGSKQTFDCPAPLAVIADIDIIEAAPPELTASGYADLLAKNTAGADWIVADALGVEPIDRDVW